MKKILITGAGGFIGSHLTEYCVEQGYDVKAFIHYNSSGQRGWMEDSPCCQDVEFIAGDVRDIDVVNTAVKGCDTIFHLAALIGIPYSYLSPLAYIKTNVEGTNNILQAARECQCENILITSTSETYGTAQYVPIDEKHPSVGQSPYAASKIAADQIALSYYRSFNTPVKVVRPFNTFGPRQSARAIIPTVVTQILNGRTELYLGRTSPTRDFTFVRDTVRGFLTIARCDELVGQEVNVGNNKEISIEQLVYFIAELLGTKVTIKTDEQRLRPEKSEVERLVCNNERLMALTDWTPEVSLREGLEETIQFLRDRLKTYKTEIYNV